METFVEVVRRGMEENRNELSVTYTVPQRSDEEGEQSDRFPEDLPDLPDLVPIRDGEQVRVTNRLLHARPQRVSHTGSDTVAPVCTPRKHARPQQDSVTVSRR